LNNFAAARSVAFGQGEVGGEASCTKVLSIGRGDSGFNPGPTYLPGQSLAAAAAKTSFVLLDWRQGELRRTDGLLTVIVAAGPVHFLRTYAEALGLAAYVLVGGRRLVPGSTGAEVVWDGEVCA
jgi:hypothetical protein